MKRIFEIVLISISLFACKENKLREIERFNVNSGYHTAGLYKTIDGVYEELNKIKSEHTSEVQIFDIGKSSVGNKSIPLLRITIGNSKIEEHYLFVSGSHGDEGAPIEALLYSIKQILRAKDTFDSLKSNTIVLDFIPLHNPDGYEDNERKNANGIDLNRNFPLGSDEIITEPENVAIVELINSIQYKSSIFFHSANEEKYENIIRRPIEYSKFGESALNDKMNLKLNEMISIISNISQPKSISREWTVFSSMVPKPGIASDWCVSGELKPEFKYLISTECINPHPSLTVELCFPKTPIDVTKLENEKLEMYTIISSLLKR